MIKTQSGRVSRTQKLHIVSAVLQAVNASVFTMLGVPADVSLGIATLLGMVQSGIGMYLRTVTSESM